MKDGSKAKIFLAADRGHTETAWFRSYNTFNFGGYQSDYKTPFGELYVWNDDTLAGGKSFQVTVEEDSYVLLLPVVGALQYNDGVGNESLLQAGQVFFCFAAKGTAVRLTNPYEESLINFLQGWFKAENAVPSASTLTSFQLDDEKNRLLQILAAAAGINCSIGKFDGRSEGVFRTTNIHSRVFVFIVQGAFEVQNRLLETRDGLALWETNEIAFEALSNEAIILIAEMAATQQKARP